jgi:release factor glutamine methyltransferase
VTIATALAAARTLGLDRLDAQLLLAHLLQRPRSWVLAHDDDPLSAEQTTAYETLCRRRAAGEPLAYLVGEREFHGLVLRVSPAVLIPRPDTETLVDWALELLATDPALATLPNPEVLDLGTGSGAIALAVKHRCGRARVQALDASPQALAVAQANAKRLQIDVGFLLSDWWSMVTAPVHLALSNPPYIAGGDPHLAALRHEPQQALTPGGDGLGAIDRLAAGAHAGLHPGGWLLIEHGHDQGEAARQRLKQAGLVEVSTRRDIEARERCSGGRRPG